MGPSLRFFIGRLLCMRYSRRGFRFFPARGQQGRRHARTGTTRTGPGSSCGSGALPRHGCLPRPRSAPALPSRRSEEHTSELQSRLHLLCPLFFFKCYGDHRDLHSFPTRRSSDLDQAAGRGRSPGTVAFPVHDLRLPSRPEDRKSTRLNSSHGYISYALFFFLNATATTEIYTLSLHDALPIWIKLRVGGAPPARLPSPSTICACPPVPMTLSWKNRRKGSFASDCNSGMTDTVTLCTPAEGTSRTPDRRLPTGVPGAEKP